MKNLKYNEQHLPVVYHQLKRIKSIWERSKSEDRDGMIKMLDESLEQIKQEYKGE